MTLVQSAVVQRNKSRAVGKKIPKMFSIANLGERWCSCLILQNSDEL